MKSEERKRLRHFGIVMALAFVALGVILIWRQRSSGPYLAALGGVFLLTGFLVPVLLAPVERAWMAFAGVLQRITTILILTLTYYVLVTPLGLLVRLLGKDLLGRRPDPEIESYWVAVEADGPHTRPNKPY